MVPIAISLGSNVGNSAENVRRAGRALASRLQSWRMSSLYATAPLYVLDQDEFINAAAIASTDLSPRALVEMLKELESELGRQSRYVNGPREIDLDLISYGALRYQFSGPGTRPVQAPHPRFSERRFVLEPLAEIDPSFTAPGQPSVQELLNHPDVAAQSIRKLDHAAV